VGKQIVMDATGDTEHNFNPADAAAVADAEKRFTELTRAGFNRARNDGATPRPRLSLPQRNTSHSSSRGHRITIA
jgi:hypothetical protein